MMEQHEHPEVIESSGDPCCENEFTLEEKEEIYAQAVRRARMKMAVYLHAALFVGVMLLLTAINLLTTPRTLWVLWPLFGWGIGLLLHWFLSAKLVGMYENIKDEEIARQLEIRKPQ